MELLDAVLTITGCKRATQLKNLSTTEKAGLAHAIEERVPEGLASIEEWNELLSCFIDVPPFFDNYIAKQTLICHLRGTEYIEPSEEITKRKWWHFKKG